MLLRDTSQEADVLVIVASQEKATMMWHRRLGHISKRGLKVFIEHNLLYGLRMINLPLCEHHVIRKHHTLKFDILTTRSKHILDLIHSEMWE